MNAQGADSKRVRATYARYNLDGNKIRRREGFLPLALVYHHHYYIVKIENE